MSKPKTNPKPRPVPLPLRPAGLSPEQLAEVERQGQGLKGPHKHRYHIDVVNYLSRLILCRGREPTDQQVRLAIRQAQAAARQRPLQWPSDAASARQL